MNKLKLRILEISKKYELAHIGSNLSAVDIIDALFKKGGELILSAGHAGLAYFVCLEKYKGEDAEELLKEHGIHAPMFGSLGHGLPIALGKAIATKKDIHCLTSDGEWCEGSMWEALRLAKELKAYNLKVYVNANGFGGLGKINGKDLEKRIKSFGFPVKFIYTNTKPLKGLSAHYQKL